MSIGHHLLSYFPGLGHPLLAGGICRRSYQPTIWAERSDLSCGTNTSVIEACKKAVAAMTCPGVPTRINRLRLMERVETESIECGVAPLRTAGRKLPDSTCGILESNRTSRSGGGALAYRNGTSRAWKSMLSYMPQERESPHPCGTMLDDSHHPSVKPDRTVNG